MSPFRRYRWFLAAAGITLAFAAVSLTAHKSVGLMAFADLFGLLAMVLAAGITLANALKSPRSERSFWILMTLGFTLWACNQAAWTYCEVVLRQPIPDPYFFDIILFFHVVPMIAAAAWRPDLIKREGRARLALLSFLMLLGWWTFLYAFIVFPHQYVVSNVVAYNIYYDHLYLLENALLLAVLGFAALTSSGGWRRVYTNFFAVGVLYGINSQFLDRAVANESYYSGCLLDVPLIAAVVWLAATALSAREWNLVSIESGLKAQWRKIIPRLAMLAILSLPVLGLWTVLLDKSPVPSRIFRVFAVLAAMTVLGAFVFLRQYILDQALMGVLQESLRSYEGEKRLQGQLVQKEKLASLGTLVAGAANEINQPLTAIMDISEELWTSERLTKDQNDLLRKIVNQAQRTRDLVTNLLSFARQAPGEKSEVDLNLLLNRATQMLESRNAGGKIRISVSIEPGLPRVHGNINQLFQVFVEIIENAIDALHDVSGGLLELSAARQGNEVVLEFSDSGPGMNSPGRVFDPFYTTKPVGKGTGLGLSAVYGVVQDHGGQISCRNKTGGGALFVVKLPVAVDPAVQAAGAAGL